MPKLANGNFEGLRLQPLIAIGGVKSFDLETGIFTLAESLCLI